MKLVLLKTNLKECLDVVSHATGENTNLPILKNILIKSFNNQIKVSATNLELAITKLVSGKIIEEGGLTIPANTLMSLINNLSDERINLEHENNSLVIKSDNYEARVQGMSQDEFPIIPQIKENNYYLKIDSGLLRDALAQVMNATQYTDWRPELNGILLDYQPSGLTMVATDSFRLAKKVILASQLESNWNEEKIILPLKTAQELARILNDGQTMNILYDKSQIVFVSDDLEVISRVIDGNFPDYEAIIPKSFTNEVVLDKAGLVNGLKLAGIFSSRVNDVRLSIQDSRKMIEIYSSNSQLGENKYLLPVQATQILKEIVFNWKYFIDGLKTIGDKDIFIGVNGEDKPVMIKSLSDQSLIYLLMPIRM